MRGVFTYCIFFLSCVPLWGQVTVLSETNTRDYQVNEPFHLNIGVEIIGEQQQQQSPVKLPDLSKFEILGNTTETLAAVDSETGEFVRQVIYRLVLMPKQPGKTKIGSALVRVNGKIYKSEPFDISIKEGRKMTSYSVNDIYLTMEVMNREIYQNQPIQIVLKANGKNVEDFRKINDIRLPNSSGNVYPIGGYHKDIEVDERQMASQVIASFLMISENAGNVVVSPVFAKVNQNKMVSNPLRIRVKNLPQNAPKSFKNAVGNFEISLKASQTESEKDKPIDVFVTLKGEGNLKNITLPKIRKSENYTLMKPKRKDRIIADEKGFVGEVEEHYVLVPKKEGEIEIYLDEFSFFNTQSKKYETIEEQEISLISHQNYYKKEDKSTIEKVIDDTGHILKKVELLPLSEEEKRENNWAKILLFLPGILGVLYLFYFFIFRKNKIRKNREKKYVSEKITTIAETEQILKERFSVGKKYYFESLKKYAEAKDKAKFFDCYEELHSDAEKNSEKGNLDKWREKLGSHFKEYEELREKIQMEKYSPLETNLYELYNKIVKIYSKIMK